MTTKASMSVLRAGSAAGRFSVIMASLEPAPQRSRAPNSGKIACSRMNKPADDQHDQRQRRRCVRKDAGFGLRFICHKREKVPGRACRGREAERERSARHHVR